MSGSYATYTTPPRRNGVAGSRLSPATVWLAALTVLLATGYFLFYLNAGYQSDDLSYIAPFNGFNGTPAGVYKLWDYPRWAARHWVYINGRFANDLLTLLLLTLPRWFVALLCGAATAGMYAALLSLCRLWRNAAVGSLLIAAVYFAMAWWDSFTTYAVVFNYCLTSCLLLWAVWLLLYRPDNITAAPRGRRWLMYALAFLAGGMHEGASMPLLAGITVYFFTRPVVGVSGKGLTTQIKYRWHSLDRRIRIYLIWLTAGTLLCTLAPGIVLRTIVDAGGHHDDRLWQILLKSAPIPLIFIAVTAIFGCFRAGRRKLGVLSRTPWIVFAAGMLPALATCTVSGVVGRSGWYASLYALIALTRLLMSDTEQSHSYLMTRRWLGASVSVIAGCAVVAHLAECAIWQAHVGRQLQDMTALYRKTPDGVIYYDYTRESELPRRLMGRVKGVPNADDSYALYCMSLYHRSTDFSRHRLTVLPPAMQTADVSRLRGELPLPHGDILTDSMSLNSPFRIDYSVPEEAFNRRLREEVVIGRRNGATWTATRLRLQGRTLWLLQPSQPTPGKRLHPLR